jgi:hypothetical protein
MGAIVTITVLIWKFWLVGGLNKSVPPQLRTAIGYVYFLWMVSFITGVIIGISH